MAWEGVTATTRLLGRALARSTRRLVASVEDGPFLRWRWPGALPERLVIAPQDIRTSDPTRAADIYAGLFAFGGKLVETGGRSPFDMPSPSDDWARQLHSFAWLRHLKAADGALTRSNARALVSDWIAQEARAPAIALEPEVTARRLLAFVTQSPLILEDADRAFYRRFLKSVVRHIRLLRRGLKRTQEGYPTLICLIAIAEAAIALDGQTRLVRLATQKLDAELLAQILPDGGHVSRNPQVILDLLVDLLPLRQAYTARGVAPSAALLGAIDRMMPMLRFFRHRNGEFARFNGMGTTPVDTLAAVLAHDDARGRPVANASHSGYQRLDCGRTTLIVDMGAPPPRGFDGGAHAGCLAFEMSAGASRFIVNCGGAEGPDLWSEAARHTAAHSTLTVEDTSSLRFVASPRLRRLAGTTVLAGPREVTSERLERHNDIAVTGSHDGYLARFGLVHRRSLTLSADGEQILGVDRLDGKAETAGRRAFAIRFHLHPAIRASRTEGGAILMLAPDGEAWSFASADVEPELAESVYLSAVHGRRRSQQIVLAGRVAEAPEITWSMQREAAGRAPVRRAR
ncbi:heparinase II/III family protein [Methylobrevis pamukkalensis]|uniref:Heparinase II/III-like protein n=1 Tax=Methylobrevis pamukkalensis TaxID=1439726 RepID=A0A1E3H6W7_9HYPH|nr:heparinase II/III family protein [Methylobrevis pamukkalensis]ODN72078.1 Heparinase II/III-like protein [Methylobrevis pamukkalensis]